MRALRIVLPWPAKPLRPNGGHGHWAVKAAAVKKARFQAKIIAQAEGARAGMVPVNIAITFHPPSKNYPDWDNARASCKAALDGIADAFGGTDAGWTFSEDTFAEPIKGGAVIFIVTVKQEAPQCAQTSA